MPDWVTTSGWQTPNTQPSEVIRAAGYAIILASAAAALLPAGNFEHGPQIVGGLMFFVGLVEVMANLLRATGRKAAVAAGMASVGAGILIFAQPVTTFLTTVYVFIGWLLVRSLLLFLSATEGSRAIRRAVLLAAATDLILEGIVWTGLSASTLVIALFGPTKPIIADFAWVLAVSFVGPGLLLVRIASDESET